MRCYALLSAIEREIGYRTQDKIRSLERMMHWNNFSNAERPLRIEDGPDLDEDTGLES